MIEHNIVKKHSKKTLREILGNIFCCQKLDAVNEEEVCCSYVVLDNQRSDEIKIPYGVNDQHNMISFEEVQINLKKKIKYIDVEFINSLDSSEIEAESDDLSLTEIEEGDYLPKKLDNKPILVLDLDNTLVYPTNKKPLEYTHEITIKFGGKYQSLWLIERPCLQQFIDDLYKYFEIIVFTAGIRQYGMKVLKKIDSKSRIKYLLDRRYCTVYGKNSKNQDLYIKNLHALGRDLKKTIIIDDREYSYILNKTNGQWIPPFNGEIDDDALIKLRDYLLSIRDLEDFRNREHFYQY